MQKLKIAVAKSYKALIAIFLFLIASLTLTFPLFLKMDSFVSAGGLGDGFLYIWNAYTFWHQLLSGKNPFFTTSVFYPVGVNLMFHDYSPLTSLLLGFFGNNLVMGMNAMILLAFTMASFATFILIRVATKNYLLSLVAGLIYGFSPIMFSYLLTEHYYYLFASAFLPLGVLNALKFWQKRQIRYVVFLLILFWLVFFTSYYMSVAYLVMVISIFLVKILTCLYSREQICSLNIFRKSILLIFLFAFLPFIFILLFVFNINHSQQYKISGSSSAQVCNADLAGYLIPSNDVPYLHNISLKLSMAVGYHIRGDTPSYYIGLVYLVLAAISFLKFRKKSDILGIGIAGLIIFLLSLGTRIQIGNLILLQGILTPFYWFASLPFISFILCPVRFPIAVLLSVIFLSFFLINEIIKRYKLSGIFVCLFLLVLFFFEYGIPKEGFASTKVPAVYKMISQTQDNLTVLELPSGLTETDSYFGYDYSISGLHAKQMYWQSIYQKNRVGGFISRIPETTYQFFMTEPVISDIFGMTNYESLPINKKYTREEVDKFIKKFNIGYIVFSPNNKQNEYLEAMENLLKGFHYQTIYSEGFILISVH